MATTQDQRGERAVEQKEQDGAAMDAMEDDADAGTVREAPSVRSPLRFYANLTDL